MGIHVVAAGGAAAVFPTGEMYGEINNSWKEYVQDLVPILVLFE